MNEKPRDYGDPEEDPDLNWPVANRPLFLRVRYFREKAQELLDQLCGDQQSNLELIIEGSILHYSASPDIRDKKREEFKTEQDETKGILRQDLDGRVDFFIDTLAMLEQGCFALEMGIESEELPSVEPVEAIPDFTGMW